MATTEIAYVSEFSINDYPTKYMLYNGIALPDIEPIWPDKENYPYAYILYTSGIADSEMCEASFVIFSPIRCYYDEGIVVPEGVTIQITSTTTNIGFADFINTGFQVWKEELSTVVSNNNTYKDSICWSNEDILTSDGSIYLSTSEPLECDDMSVILWNNISNGLNTIIDQTYFLISTNTNLNLSKNIIRSWTNETTNFTLETTIHYDNEKQYYYWNTDNIIYRYYPKATSEVSAAGLYAKVLDNNITSQRFIFYEKKIVKGLDFRSLFLGWLMGQKIFFQKYIHYTGEEIVDVYTENGILYINNAPVSVIQDSETNKNILEVL